MVQEAKALYEKICKRITCILWFSKRNMICFQRGLQIGELQSIGIYTSKICQLVVKANTDIWVQKHCIANEHDDSGVPNKDVICCLHEEPMFYRRLSYISILIFSTGNSLKYVSKAFAIYHSVLSSLLPLWWLQELPFKRVSHRVKIYATHLLTGASTEEWFIYQEPHP